MTVGDESQYHKTKFTAKRHKEYWCHWYAHLCCEWIWFAEPVQNTFYICGDEERKKKKRKLFRMLKSLFISVFFFFSAGFLHKLAPLWQKHLYCFAAMDSFTRYSKTVFYKSMISFQDLHKKIAENQILRTANQSSELYPH